MFNLVSKWTVTDKLIFFCLTLSFLISSLLFSKSSYAQPPLAIVGPISVVGEVPIPEQQILFNRFREKLNKRYQLVSHKVLELISEQGLSSIDIEDCTNSRCIRDVQKFVKILRQQFNTDELFLFQLVRSKSETQISLKLTSLSQPEVTRKFVSQTCPACNIENLEVQVDLIVQRMFDKIAGEDVALPKEAVASENVAPLREEIALPEDVDRKKPKKRLKLYEEQTLAKTEADPYIVDRDLYNRQISKLLIDVTYALQIFRSGMFVQLKVSIDPSGSVVDQKIIKSSGSNDFDDTAIMSLDEIQFAPLPKTMLKFGNYVVILQIQNSR